MKISLSNLLNYISVSGDSKQKKIPKKVVLSPQLEGGGPLCGGHHLKLLLFSTPPLSSIRQHMKIDYMTGQLAETGVY